MIYSRLKLLLLGILIYSAVVIGLIGKSGASNQYITCTETSCYGVNGSLFSITNIQPLQQFEQKLTAFNSSSTPREFEVFIDDFSLGESQQELAKWILITITKDGDPQNIYGPVTLEEWITNGNVKLGSIPPNGTQSFVFTATISNLGNEFQSKQIGFDLIAGFTSASVQTATTPTQPSLGDGGRGGYVCSASLPSAAPSVQVVSVGQNVVLLNWTDISPSTHYMIQYGTNGQWLYGNANVGLSTSYEVERLSANTDYNFRVAAVNDCAPGPWSAIQTSRTTGQILAVTLPAPGFEQILGVQDEVIPSAETIANAPDVLGASDTCSTKIVWWIPLVVQLVLSLGFILFKPKYLLGLSGIVLLAVLSQLSHWILGCGCGDLTVCRYYLWFVLLGGVVSFVSLTLISKKRSS